jgi:hypothetical protein
MNIPPLANLSAVYPIPSQHSNTATISSSTHDALDILYKKIYGEDSWCCLLMQFQGGLNVAHGASGKK